MPFFGFFFNGKILPFKNENNYIYHDINILQ
jgi:hypothetical protein